MPDQENQKKSSGDRKTHRALELLETLRRLGGSARTSHLADIMNVSEETVRRTVKKLSKDGTVSRAHGGVYLALEQSSSPIHLRIREQAEQKIKMAAMLLDMVEDSSSLFLDVGSTTIFVAEALRAKKNLTIVTNSLSIAQILMNHNQNRVFLAGGELEDELGGTFGSVTQKFVEKFTMDFAILSSMAIDEKRGFLLNNSLEAELAQSFASHAHKCIMMADATKIGQRAPIIACLPTDIDCFITDKTLAPNFANAMKNWEIEVIAAEEKTKAANNNFPAEPPLNTQQKKKKRK
ncbi:MAG: DeoR/GlpR family DNA-binding transcription regulator [Devosiaceae bacterium]|nr:DeoR/GlpR family DNA-binding transcription regulator [Devosiaceae bacterium]